MAAINPDDTADSTGAPWWLRLHRALMPDYNRKAATYWWIGVLGGAMAIAYSLASLASQTPDTRLQIAVGIGIAMVAGLFPVRVPRSTNSFAAGEIFIVLLLLLYGPAAAVLASAGEGLIGACRTSKRWTSRIVTPAMASLAMLASGSLLHATITLVRAHGMANAGVLLVATTACTVLYFLLNTALIAAVPYLKRSERPRLHDMLGNWGWVGLTFAGSASVACLLYLSFEKAGFAILLGAVPVIAMLLTAVHSLFRQQEIDEARRQERVVGAEREAEVAARHMRELEVSERRFHNAFSHASIGMALVTFDARVLQVNPALCRLIGASDGGSLLQEPIGTLVVEGHIADLHDRLFRLQCQQLESFELELPLRHRHGDEVWAVVHGSVFDDQDSASPCLILQVQDVTARRRAEAGLQQIAFHDSLTGLPNRRRLLEQLTQALDRVQRDHGHHFALMFLDFDRFKMINDSLGHAVGDEFLVAVACRIQQQVRSHDIVARLGGDEFAILAEDLDSGRYAVGLAERVLDALRQPIDLGGTELATSASIGITFSSMGYTDPAHMLRDADTAMYKAKSSGKARYALFDAALHTHVAERMRLEGELRRALAEGGLAVAFQPIFDLASGRITGFEALARWHHPELGAIAPGTFISVAEESGLIVQLTDFVLRTACSQLREWQRQGQEFADLNVHVNLSGADVAHLSLVSRVIGALGEAQLQPQHLTLELTENILMERLALALPALNELRALGVALSVDDFGTGYSSLQHLATLPVDSLKIDRAFVTGIGLCTSENAIVRAVLLIGESLGKPIIAEGIETAEQLDHLTKLGCSGGQGYFLSRPLPAQAVSALLTRITTEHRGRLVSSPAVGLALMH